MTWQLTFADNYKRLMFGIIADSRVNIPSIKDQPGSTILSYVQAQTVQIVPGVIPYGIRTPDGNLAGYVAIRASPGPVSILLLQLRPAFTAFSDDISNFLTNFINGGNFIFDILT